MTAFLKKEWMELIRTGRGFLLLLIFILFGIMNPGIAKLTPWMMEMMSGSLEEVGFLVTDVTVDAMTSWTQFYKNIPMALIIFVLLCSGSFTAEYQRGTLIAVVTKGLSRRKIVIAKTVMLSGLWTVMYFLCYGITLGYNAYFWDNSIAAHYLFGAVCYWLFGIWVIAWLVFFSTLSKSNIQVLLGTGMVAFGVYVLGMFPKLCRFLPSKLMEGMVLLQGKTEPEEYYPGMMIAGVTAVLCILLSFFCFDRKKL